MLIKNVGMGECLYGFAMVQPKDFKMSSGQYQSYPVFYAQI